MAIEKIHAEKENGQESQKASYDSPVTPRQDRPPLGGGKQIAATNLFASLTPRAQTVRGTAYSLSRLSIDRLGRKFMDGERFLRPGARHHEPDKQHSDEADRSGHQQTAWSIGPRPRF